MKTFGNIMWLLFGGIAEAISQFLMGVWCFISLWYIPLGKKFFQLGTFLFWPFGKTVVPAKQKPHGYGAFANILFAIFVGWELMLSYYIAGALICCTIVGIPFCRIYFRVARFVITPLSHDIVPIEDVKNGKGAKSANAARPAAIGTIAEAAKPVEPVKPKTVIRTEEKPYHEQFYNENMMVESKEQTDTVLRKLFSINIEEVNREHVEKNRTVTVEQESEAPVVLKRYQFLTRTTDDDSELLLRTEWLDVNNRGVSSILFDIQCFNYLGAEVLLAKDISFEVQNIEEVTKYGIVLHEDMCAGKIILKKVVFSDQSVWEVGEEFAISSKDDRYPEEKFYSSYHPVMNSEVK